VNGLTLPSRGRPQSGFACLRPPLMSNVRALVRARSIASMHYGPRTASRVRFLLLSRNTVLHRATPRLDAQRKVSSHQGMPSHGVCNGTLGCAASQA
jgi:hypothetical protein